MSLSIESRQVGDVSVLKCIGRITQGAESAVLEQQLDGLVTRAPYIVLDLSAVDFVDSSGLGLLVRYHMRTRAADGHLKLCSVTPRTAEILRMTNLTSVFELHVSADDAIAASYRPAASGSTPYRFATDILCVDRSVDVQCYVREMLAQAGYGIMTAGNLPDALTLLQATRPKVVIVSAELRASRQTQTAERFNQIADTCRVVELPPGFSHDEAGDAGTRLIEQVRAVVGEPGRTRGTKTS